FSQPLRRSAASPFCALDADRVLRAPPPASCRPARVGGTDCVLAGPERAGSGRADGIGGEGGMMPSVGTGGEGGMTPAARGATATGMPADGVVARCAGTAGGGA